VPRPIAEFSDARAIDRGIGLAAAAAPPERLADLGDQPLQRSAQVDAQPGFPVVAVALPSSPAQAAAQPASTPAAAWPQWPAATASKGPDLLAAAGGLALVVLGLRVLFGGRRRYDTFPTRAN
jgi:hypothetical protein